jgi:hypothetical protein
MRSYTRGVETVGVPEEIRVPEEEPAPLVPEPALPEPAPSEPAEPARRSDSLSA